MASKNKLYEIYTKYNLNEQKQVAKATKKPQTMLETYQAYRINKFNFVHHNEYKKLILSEAVFGNIYKGTVYLAKDDIDFLKQFDPYYWKQALFMRYDKYLYTYLRKLNQLRMEEYKQIFDYALEHEKSIMDTDPLYVASGKSSLGLAKLHAKDIAKSYVDKRFNYTTVPPEADSGLQPFDLVERGFDGVRIFAKPYIKELVKRLEGTIGVHDGYDLHNPKEINVRTTSASGEDKVVSKKKTDGFSFPSKEAIRDMIEDYLRLLGNQIVKYDVDDLKYKPNHPDIPASEMREKNAVYKAFRGEGGRKMVDSMAYELSKDFLVNSEIQKLIRQYRASGQEVNTQELRRQAETNVTKYLDKLISEGKLKTGKREIRLPDPDNPSNELVIKPEDLPTGERGNINKIKELVKSGPKKGETREKLVHPDLYLLQQTNFIKQQKIKFNKNGEVIPGSEKPIETVEVEMPVLKPGHSYRRLTRTEVELLDKLKDVGNDVSKLTPGEQNLYYSTFAGDPSSVLRGEHMDIENADHPDENKRFRSLYVHSEHMPESNKQGSEHSRAGGFFPNAETPERRYLRKYDLRITDDAIEKFHNPKYASKIDVLFGPDGIGRDLRNIIQDYIQNRLSSGEMQETFNLRVERQVLMMFLPQLIDMGAQKVFENLDEHNIETDASVTRHLLNLMLTSMEQQDFGRGSRRRRQNSVAASPSEAADLFSFTRAINCGPGVRKMETGTCHFAYRLDQLEELANSLSQDVKSMQGTIGDDSASVSEKETSMGEIISSFQFAMHDLGLAYLAKAFYDNPNANWPSLSVKEEFAKKAQAEADAFVEGILSSLSGTQTEQGSTIKAGMAIEMIKAEIESTLKASAMPADVNPLVIRADRELDEHPTNHAEIIQKYRQKQVPDALLDLVASHTRQIQKTINAKTKLIKDIIAGTIAPTLIFTINPKYLERATIQSLIAFLDQNLRDNTNFAQKQKEKIQTFALRLRTELDSRQSKGVNT